MKINLKSNFDLGMETIELDGAQVTLRRLLNEVAARSPGNPPLIDPKSDDLDEFFVVSVNGQEHRFLLHGLDAPIKDGDEVHIAVVSFGGG